MNDVRFAFRQLRRNPGFSLIVVLTLALGIGANASIFSLVNAVFLRPPPCVQQPDRLVWIYTSDFSGPPYGASSYPDFQAFREQTKLLSAAAAFSPKPVNLVESGQTTRLMSELVSADYFDVLGVRPQRGRGFIPNEGREPAAVAVIGDGLWHRRFGGDPAIVGKAIHLNGGTFTVVGVAPPGYRGSIRGLQVDVWIPFRAQQLLMGRQDFIDQRGNRGLLVIGRLAPGVTPDRAQAGFRVVAASLYRAYPKSWVDVKDHGRSITVVPERISRVPMMLRGPALGLTGLLLTVVGLVLLLCCANVANLLLARAAGRSREFGIRLSLGATRKRLARQLLTESALLAALGGVAGLLSATWSARLLAKLLPPLPIRLHLDVSLDWRVVLFATAASGLTALLFGLAPALRSARADVTSTLKEVPAAGRVRRMTLQSALVVVQVAVSIVLLVGAGLLLRSLSASQRVDVGLDPQGVVVAGMDLSTQGYEDQQRVEFYRGLERRLSHLPGTTGVALGSSVPLSLRGSRTGAGVEGYEPRQGEDMEFRFAVVGPNYFRVLRIPLLRGRGFSAADRAGAPPVVIVNEAFARRFWPDQDPLGKRLNFAANLKNLTVVGVVPTGKYTSLAEDPTPFLYLSYLQAPQDMLVHIRSTRQAERVIPGVRRAVHEIDPDLPLTTLAPMTEVMATSRLPQRIGAAVLTLFAALAMLLAAVGLYGVMAAVVSRRTREIGIRVALGADRRRIVRLVVGRGLGITVLGLTVGLALAAVLSHLLSRFTFGIQTLDPPAFIGMSVLFAAVATAACYLPARRASRVEPMAVLREE
jgi:predicted permease